MLSELNAKLPEFLRRTQNELNAELERQNFTAAYDEWAVRYRRAITDEAKAKEALQRQEATEFNLTLLAESLLEQGYFEEASSTHPDGRYGHFLARIARANFKKPCPHPLYFNYTEVRDGQRHPVKVPNFRLWRTVFAGSFDKRTNIFICNKCLGIWKENL